MTALGARTTMTHLCTLLRNQGGTSSWGIDDNFQPYLTDVPCRAWFLIERVQLDQSQYVSVETRHLALPVGTDVSNLDRVDDVTFRGVVFFPGVMHIDTLLNYPDRIELILKAAS